MQSFLDRFEPDERARFEGASTLVHVAPGTWLIRRGDAGGDIYVLEEGQLEVIDTSGSAPNILAVLDPGAVVGEVSYLDDSPRSADVRARSAVRVRLWKREDVRALMHRDPTVAARFLESLATTVARRLRRLTDTTRTGAGGATAATLGGDGDLLGRIGHLTEAVKDGLASAEARLRADPDDAMGAGQLRAALDRLQADTDVISRTNPDPDVATRITERIRRELSPWLLRSALAAHCLRDRDDATVSTAVVDHVLHGVPKGDGPIGLQIDQWLLDRPSLRARRAAEARIAELLGAVGPSGPAQRILLLDTPAPRRIEAIASRLSERSALLTMVDPSREVLERATSEIARQSGLTGAAVQESVVRLALGRAVERLPAHDVVLLWGLLSYLPDRIALPVLELCAGSMQPGGAVLLSGVTPGPDAWILGRLLRWPVVRRHPSRLERLALRAGLVVQDLHAIASDGWVLVLAAR